MVHEIAVPDDEELVVRTPEEFVRAPRDYQNLLTSQVLGNVVSALSRGDDYTMGFLPLAPSVDERQVCAERAAEEYGHYKLGRRVLAEIGVDTTGLETRPHDGTAPAYTTWAERGLFSYLGEEAALVLTREFARSSYHPWADAVRVMVADEKTHIAHGARVCRNVATTARGREELQAAVDRMWPTFLAALGDPDPQLSGLAVRYGLRRSTAAQARDQWLATATRRVTNLGLRAP